MLMSSRSLFSVWVGNLGVTLNENEKEGVDSDVSRRITVEGTGGQQLSKVSKINLVYSISTFYRTWPQSASQEYIKHYNETR